jgi:hypothetical protein
VVIPLVGLFTQIWIGKGLYVQRVIQEKYSSGSVESGSLLSKPECPGMTHPEKKKLFHAEWQLECLICLGVSCFYAQKIHLLTPLFSARGANIYCIYMYPLLCYGWGGGGERREVVESLEN